MKWTLIIVFAVGLWLYGYPEGSTSETPLTTIHDVLEEAFPFTIDPGKSAAYIGEAYLSVFFVGASDVMHVTLVLPIAETPQFKVPLSMEGPNAIVHYSGPSVAEYVLPQGAKRPFPDTPEYIQRRGISGIAVCQNPPINGRFEYGRRIVLSLGQIDFGDGKRYQFHPMELTVAAFPP